MAQHLPYRVTTQTGETLDFEFALHPDTGSALRVNQLLSAVLEALDREIRILGETSNGDVLQSVAMALAARARMIHAPAAQTGELARTLVDEALRGAMAARADGGLTGHG
jgi:hypothetical protein